MNDEKFIYAGELNEELMELEKMFDKDNNVMDASTVTVGCMAVLTFLCC